jgi:hypothetical protein
VATFGHAADGDPRQDRRSGGPGGFSAHATCFLTSRRWVLAAVAPELTSSLMLFFSVATAMTFTPTVRAVRTSLGVSPAVTRCSITLDWNGLRNPARTSSPSFRDWGHGTRVATTPSHETRRQHSGPRCANSRSSTPHYSRLSAALDRIEPFAFSVIRPVGFRPTPLSPTDGCPVSAGLGGAGELDLGSPVLDIRRSTRDRGGQAVVHVHIVVPADRVSLAYRQLR